MLKTHFVLQPRVLTPPPEVIEIAAQAYEIQADEIILMTIAAAKAARDRANDFDSELIVHLEIEVIEHHLCVAAVVSIDSLLELDGNPGWIVIGQDSYAVTLCKCLNEGSAPNHLKALSADLN